MLRASLELSGRGYIVIDVTSGEEALMELARGPVDLLVTDVRLPGISGIDLLGKVRQQNPQARAILITGAPTDEVQAEAEALGVVAFLRKPLATSFFLEAVDSALRPAGTAAPPVVSRGTEEPHLAERLARLRRELGAEAAFLIGENGRIAVRAGDLINLDLDASLPSLMAAFSAGLKVSSLLGSQSPGNFQHFDGDTHEFYLANVGTEYALLIVFRGKQEAGQMGAVVYFGRRAANDLLNDLSSLGVVKEEEPAPVQPPAPEPEPEAPEVMEPELETATGSVANQDVDDFWKQAVADSKKWKSADGDALTYEQARKLGLIPEDPGR
jgi:CheY-like chemotaxis protein